MSRKLSLTVDDHYDYIENNARKNNVSMQTVINKLIVEAINRRNDYKEYGRRASKEDKEKILEAYNSTSMTRAELARKYNVNLRYIGYVIEGRV